MGDHDKGARSALLEKIRARSARVGVIGLGYVGLPLALLFEDAGFSVAGLDIDPAKVRSLQEGRSYIRHISSETVAAALTRGRISMTTDFGRLSQCEVIVICVPTPLGRHRDPDLSFIRQTSDAVAKHLHIGQLVVLESTTYPGTTRDELLPRFLSKGLACGKDFFLAFSPEREDPGNTAFTTKNVPKIVGGVDPDSLEVACAFYGAALDHVVPVSSTEVAEAAKLLENIFRAVNISLVNEMKMVLDRLGIDVWEVIEAAKTKPFGFMPFYPGPGLGGHCIPIDPFYLSWKAREHGTAPKFIELAGEISHGMPHWVVGKLQEALNRRERPVSGSRILVLGVAYKRNVDDARESPAFEVIDLLKQLGAQVSYHDPHIGEIGPTRRHRDMLGMRSVPLTQESLSQCDAAVIVTDHAAVDYALVARWAPLVVDTRGIMRSISAISAEVVSA